MKTEKDILKEIEKRRKKVKKEREELEANYSTSQEIFLRGICCGKTMTLLELKNWIKQK